MPNKNIIMTAFLHLFLTMYKLFTMKIIFCSCKSKISYVPDSIIPYFSTLPYTPIDDLQFTINLYQGQQIYEKLLETQISL